MTNAELTEWINEYGKEIYSFCKWLTGCGPEADELYQDIWLAVVRRLEGLELAGNVKGYCLSVALRLWKNKRRKWAWRQRIVPEQLSGEIGETAALELAASPEQAPSPERLLLAQERERTVREAVEGLPHSQRIVVLLYYMEEQSLEQIARITGLPPGTVKSRLYYARKALRRRLRDYMEL